MLSVRGSYAPSPAQSAIQDESSIVLLVCVPSGRNWYSRPSPAKSRLFETQKLPNSVSKAIPQPSDRPVGYDAATFPASSARAAGRRGRGARPRAVRPSLSPAEADARRSAPTSAGSAKEPPTGAAPEED